MTAERAEFLLAVADLIAGKDENPTFREIAEATDRSVSTTHKQISKLIKGGFLTRNQYREWAIELTKLGLDRVILLRHG